MRYTWFVLLFVLFASSALATAGAPRNTTFPNENWALRDASFKRLKPTDTVKGYIPGVRENGGQYTHGAIWVAMAFALMGDRERAWELFGLLNPIHHGGTPAQIATYRVEPYVVAADVYAVAPHLGRGGWTWYTGSAGWMYRLLIETLLGVNLEGDRLRLAPRLPKSWKTYKIHYRYRQTVYHITIKRVAAAPAVRSRTPKGRYTRRAIQPRERMARPGARLDSWSATGTRASLPARTTAAEVKPPNPTMTSGRQRAISRRQKITARTCEARHPANLTGRQEKAVPGTRSKRSFGYFSLNRASTFFRLIRRMDS